LLLESLVSLVGGTWPQLKGTPSVKTTPATTTILLIRLFIYSSLLKRVIPKEKKRQNIRRRIGPASRFPPASVLQGSRTDCRHTAPQKSSDDRGSIPSALRFTDGAICYQRLRAARPRQGLPGRGVSRAGVAGGWGAARSAQTLPRRTVFSK